MNIAVLTMGANVYIRNKTADAGRERTDEGQTRTAKIPKRTDRKRIDPADPKRPRQHRGPQGHKATARWVCVL